MQNRHGQTKNNISQKDGKNETISQLAHRHLLNENHTTTDEELKNARIEFNESFDTSGEEMSDIDHNTVLPRLPFEKNKDNMENKSSNANIQENPSPNPYDILE